MKLEFDTNYNDWKVTDQYGALFYGLERDAIKALYLEFYCNTNIRTDLYFEVINVLPREAASGWWDDVIHNNINRLRSKDLDRFWRCYVA